MCFLNLYVCCVDITKHIDLVDIDLFRHDVIFSGPGPKPITKEVGDQETAPAPLVP